MPQDYGRIFAFDNFNRTQKYALAKVLERDQDSLSESVPVGSYVRLHIKQVPKDIVSKVCSLSERLPLVASGLLPHESKMSVLHFRSVYILVHIFCMSAFFASFFNSLFLSSVFSTYSDDNLKDFRF